MSPSPTNVTTPVGRSRLKSRKHSGNKLSPRVKPRKPSPSPSLEICSSPKTSRRKYEVYCGSPVHIPNSQAPIPGREVYWDMDTPETKRTREEFLRESEAMEDSPCTTEIKTPKLVIVQRSRRISKPSEEAIRKGDELLNDLIQFADAIKERQEEELRLEKEKENLQQCQNNNEHLANTSDTNVSNSNIDDNFDMFDDLNDDQFPDEDDDMLLQATQAVEEEEESKVTKPETVPEVPSVVKVHPRLEACVSDGFGDVDDSFDDFVSQMDNMDIPVMKKEVTKSEKKSSVKKLVHPNVLQCQDETDGFGFGNDSMDELMSQVEMPSTSSSAIKTKLPNQPSTSPVLKKPRLNFEFKSSKTSGSSHSSVQSGINSGSSYSSKTSVIGGSGGQGSYSSNSSVKSGSGGSNSSNTSVQSDRSSGYSSSFNKSSQGVRGNIMRKFSSFDSPPKEKKLIAKFKSDTHISLPSDKKSKPICTKEEIERKRKEAMAKRKMSQTQKGRI